MNQEPESNSFLSALCTPAPLVIVLYLLVASFMNATLPLGEGPDEPAHYQYVEHVARTWRMPVPASNPEDNVTVECFQPPLYYYLSAFLAAPWAQDGHVLYYNPEFSFAYPSRGYLPGPEHAFPWRGHALGWHFIRLFSTLLGLGTLLLILRIAFAVFDDERLATAAMAVAALNPQFIYLHSLVSNDTLSIFAATLIIWLTLELYRTPSVRAYAITGAAIAFAALAKVNAVTVIPGTAVAALLAARRLPGNGQRLMALLALGGIPAAISSWWYIRNILIYGDATALALARVVVADNYWPEKIGYGHLVSLFPRMFRMTFKTYWCYFGWVAFYMHRSVYLILLGIHAVAAAGLLAYLPKVRRNVNVPALLVALMGASVVLAYIYHGRIANHSGWHGRLLMPAVSAASIALVGGLHRWFPRPRALEYTIIAAMLMLLIYALGFVFVPNYL